MTPECTSTVRLALTTPALLVAVVVLTPSDAKAYLDAGSASMLYQALIGAVAAGLFFLKTYWRRLKTALGRTPAESNTATENQSPQVTK